MACETAVVASRVGGIPEIVVEGETGYLVDYNPDDTEGFMRALAARIDEVMSDAGLASKMGKAGRLRAVREFGWAAIATRTVDLYGTLLSPR
jgi:starch synthase